jgi:penicillin-binding protein 2
MHDVTIYGTASAIQVPGVEYCAKTGTAQNPHGKNHSLFVCFAPKDNPKIAVAVIVENAGFGATWAGPIGAFIMEKYLNDTIAADRLSEVERISKADLIPDAIKSWYVKKENQRQAKLILEAEAAKAEMNADAKQNSSEEEESSEKIPLGTEKYKEQLEMILPDNKISRPVLPQNKKDSSKKKNTNTTTALLIDENKKWLVKKTKA